MPDNENLPVKRALWNKGKLIGARPPLRPKHVWSIRTRLLLGGRVRDLALFNLAIDSKLRGCDVWCYQGRGRCPERFTRWTGQPCGRRNGTARQVRDDGSEPPRFGWAGCETGNTSRMCAASDSQKSRAYGGSARRLSQRAAQRLPQRSASVHNADDAQRR